VRIGNFWKSGLAIATLIIGTTISCNRQFSVPVSAVVTPSTTPPTTGSGATNTNTPTNTPIPGVPTNTPTNSPTNTATNTPTNTPIPGVPTNTFTNTPTNTATNTVTNSPTSTPTNTPTNSPTPIFALIDDFEGTGAGGGDSITGIYNVTDQNSTLRNGALFTYVETPTANSSIVLASSSTAEQGSASLETSGFVSDSSQSNFAGWGFNFVTAAGVAAAYDATVSNAYIGISFYVNAKSMAVSNCEGVQAISAILTDNANAVSVAFPVVVGAWTPVTIFYNQLVTPSGTLLNPKKLLQAQFQILSNGYSGANNNFDILWDNFQLVPAGAPGAPAVAATPLPATVLTNFTNGSNEVQYTPASGLNGYFFNYMGAAAGDNECSLPGYVFDSAPGHVTQVIPGIPSFAAHYSGTISDYAGLGWTWAKANAQTDISTYKQLVFYAKSSDLASMSMFWVDTETNAGCYGASVNSVSIPLTTSWAAVTVTFNDTSDPGQYDLGTVSVASGTNGCTSGSYTNIPFDPTEAIQAQFEPASGAFDLWFDDMYFQ